MNFLNLDFKRLVVITILAALPLLSLNIGKKPQNTPWYLQPFSFAAGVIQNTYSSFSAGVRGTTNLYFDLIDIKKQNRTLLKENAEFRAKLGELTELRLENERLNKLLSFKQKNKMELLAAKVVGGDLLPERQSIVINRGRKHGVEAGMAAITVSGAVGYVYSNDLFTSKILLLTDGFAAIDAIVQRSRARGIIEGKTSENCSLNYLKRGDDVQKGDLVVTSGLDNIFPKGFPVGTVTEVIKSQYGVSQEVEVKPIINPNNLEEIYIILNAKQENYPNEQTDQENAEPSAVEPKEQDKSIEG